MTTTPSSRALPPGLSPRARNSGRRRLTRALSWVLTSFSVLILLGSGGGYLYVSSQFSTIKSIGGLCLKGCAGQPVELGSTENFLIVGTDSRSGPNSAGNLSGDGGTAVSGGYGNSDTTLLVHISADQKKVIVVSFPRDLLVERPAYKDASGVMHPAAPQKFNAAFSIGGPNLLISQVKALTHLPVDHYLSIDFSGFQSMVNALGGVTVCLSQDAYDPGDATTGGSGFKASKGTHKLNGVQALMYVRQRHGLPHEDLDRIARQQRFIAALVRQAKAPSTLFNPLKLNAFISAIAKNVTKDSNTSEQDLLGLVQRLKGLSASSVEFNTVPIGGSGGGATTAANPNGEYLTIDVAKAHTLFQAIFNDQDPAHPPTPSPTPKTSVAPTPATSPLTIAPADISLAVANGSGVTGQGTAVAITLRSLGYRITGVSTETRSDPSTTVVDYGADRADSARTLAAAIPGAVLTPVSSPEVLTLVVGTGYTGAHAVSIGAAAPTASAAAPATPAPSASATALDKPITAAPTDACGP